MITKFEVVAYQMRHPLNGLMSVPKVVGDYMEESRLVGLKLQFPDGHTACLTFAEIRRLQASEEDEDECIRRGSGSLARRPKNHYQRPDPPAW